MHFPRQALLTVAAFAIAALVVPRLEAGIKKKDTTQYGAGLIVNVPASQAEVTKAVEEVAANGIIRGTKEYNKDEYIAGATAAADSRLFPAWTGGGKVFYKVRLHALDPRNFKDSGDVGTLTVRYVVMPQDETHAVLRIDALFAEDFRHSVHLSNGSVESAEYKDIHDHIEALELIKQQTSDAEEQKQQLTMKKFLDSGDQPAPGTSEQPPNQKTGDQQIEQGQPQVATTGDAQETDPVNAPARSLEQRVRELRKQTERLVKAPGAPLKSAPFHSATNLASLPPGTEVLIVISTTYWYGVETHDGQHGWMFRDDLEELP